MKAELKQLWVAALRSGKYAQGKSYLRVKNEYCCLGVLCDLMEPKGWSLRLKPVVGGEYNHVFGRRTLIGGFNNTCFTIKEGVLPEETLDVLVKMNDEEISFAEIANKIEEIVPTEQD
jgi:hypothetical protein